MHLLPWHLVMWLLYLKPKLLQASTSQAKAQEVIVLIPLPLPKSKPNCYFWSADEGLQMRNSSCSHVLHGNNEANQIFEKDEKLKKYRRIGMKAVKDKDVLQKIGMAIKSNAECPRYEEEIKPHHKTPSPTVSNASPLFSPSASHDRERGTWNCDITANPTILLHLDPSMTVDVGRTR
ncbi:hypothetical protein Tco_1264683 [Tanacetum coccineum]